MARIYNLATNPSREVSNVGITVVAGTGGTAAVTRPTTGGFAGSAFARTTWSVASTAAGGGDYDTIAGLTAGTTYMASKYVRSSKIQRAQTALVWLNSSNTIVGSTVLGTQTVLAANTWTRLNVSGLAPATATQVRVYVQTVAGTSYSNWAIADFIDTDAVMLTAGASLVDYFDGDFVGRFWSSTVGLSTSYLVVTAPVLTAVPHLLTDDPPPAVQWIFSELWPTAATMNVLRVAEGRTFPVRGGVGLPTAGGAGGLDFEAPFGVVSTYRAEMFSGAGVSLGFTDSTDITLAGTDVWIHQPLDPTIGLKVRLLRESSTEIARPVTATIVYPDGGSVGRSIGGQRRGVSSTLTVLTQTLADATTLDEMWGTYDTPQIPVLCIRTPPGMRVPRTLFAVVVDPRRQDITVWNRGNNERWVLPYEEVAPPAPGLVKPLLTYDDLDAYFASGGYSAMDAAYATYLAKDTDYSKAGYAT